MDDSWPEVKLIPKDAGLFRRAFAVAVASFSSLNRTTMILPRPDGPMGSMGPLDLIPGGMKLDPTFALVFVSVFSLTVLLVIACVLLALFAQQTDAVRSLISQFQNLLGLGFAAAAGLLGGKVITAVPPGS